MSQIYGGWQTPLPESLVSYSTVYYLMDVSAAQSGAS